MFKKIFNLIFEPFKFFGSRDLSTKVVAFFDHHGWLVYVIAFLFALGTVFFKYIFPVLIS
jgi:hypothetical protein